MASQGAASDLQPNLKFNLKSLRLAGHSGCQWQCQSGLPQPRAAAFHGKSGCQRLATST
jgi:hypothetical protein